MVCRVEPREVRSRRIHPAGGRPGPMPVSLATELLHLLTLFLNTEAETQNGGYGTNTVVIKDIVMCQGFR